MTGNGAVGANGAAGAGAAGAGASAGAGDVVGGGDRDTLTQVDADEEEEGRTNIRFSMVGKTITHFNKPRHAKSTLKGMCLLEI